MAFDKYKVVDELYEKYSFVEVKKYKFSQIVYQSLENAKTYEEAVAIGEKNIMNNILSRMSNGLFSRLFSRTVDKLGIEGAFAFYNAFLEKTGMVLSDYELVRICQKPEYSNYFETTDPSGNKLLEDAIDIYNSDANIEIDSEKIINASARVYIDSIKRNKILNAEEEAEAFRKYRETNDDEYKEQIINSNLRLVVYLAKRRYVASQHDIKLDLLDLIQAGNLGVLTSFDRYDETLGVRFSTYAVRGIKNSINHLIYNEGGTIKIPDKAIPLISYMRQFRTEYLQKNHVEAPKEAIMTYLNVTEEQYDKLIEIEKVKDVESYDVPVERSIDDYYDNSGTDMIDLVEDEDTDSVEDSIIEQYYREEVLAYARKVLSPIKFRVLLKSYGLYSFNREIENTEIGKELNLSGERVRQLKIQALQKLQSNAYKINNGIPVEQDYFSTKDIKKALERKNIRHIRVVQHCVQAKTTIFRCTRCGKSFKENAKEFMKKLDCPYCSGSKNMGTPFDKKSKKYIRRLTSDNK